MFAQSGFKAALFAGLSFTLVACSSAAPSQVPVDPQIERRAVEIMAPWVSDDAPGISVAVSIDGETVFARGAGMANLEHGREIRPETVFQVASVSKQFTAFATLLLVADGKIILEDDIRTYLPELFETSTPITVADLLNHTSGLREQNTLMAMAGWRDDDIKTHDQAMEMIARQRGTNFDAGAEVEYSNTGYMLLAEIISRVSEMPFDIFMQERVFEPLDLDQTRFGGPSDALIMGRAASYYPSETGFQNILDAGESVGSTGLYTNTLDLLKWAENFRTRRVGDAMVFDLMAERATARDGAAAVFAKGQELRSYRGLETWSHGGRDAGYRSFVLRVPDEAFALSILSNRTDFDTAKMAFALVDAFLLEPQKAPAEENVSWKAASQAQLAEYAGDYEIYPGVIFTVSADEEGLKFGNYGAPAEDAASLPQIGEGRFMLSPGADISIAFEAPENGKSPAFAYTVGLHGVIPAKRVELLPFDPAGTNLSDYPGIYDGQELSTAYELTLVDGTLMAKHMRRPAFALTPYQTDVFAGEGALQKVQFVRGATGDVSGLLASGSLSENVRFSRRTP